MKPQSLVVTGAHPYDVLHEEPLDTRYTSMDYNGAVKMGTAQT